MRWGIACSIACAAVVACGAFGSEGDTVPPAPAADAASPTDAADASVPEAAPDGAVAPAYCTASWDPCNGAGAPAAPIVVTDKKAYDHVLDKTVTFIVLWDKPIANAEINATNCGGNGGATTACPTACSGAFTIRRAVELNVDGQHPIFRIGTNVVKVALNTMNPNDPCTDHRTEAEVTFTID